MALIKNRILIQTNVAIVDTDGFPKTDLYYDGYDKLIDTIKGYRITQSELKEGDGWDEIIEIDNDNIVGIIEY